MLVNHVKCTLKISLTVLSVFCFLCQRNVDNQILYKYLYCTVLYVILIKFIKKLLNVVYPILKKTANRQSARTEVLIWYCWVITKCGIVVGQSPSTVLLLGNQQVVRQITSKVLLDNKVKDKIYLGIDTNYIQV